jgi:hypothetical protein
MPEVLFQVDGELSDECLAVLAAVLLARAVAHDLTVALSESSPRRARWVHRYRGPGGWR